MTQEVIAEMHRNADPKKTKILQKFFKTGPGEYAEGDIFLGISVPVTRKIAKRFFHLSLSEITTLLQSPEHEIRLLALIILVNKFTRSNEKERADIFNTYLKNTARINNWDLVDVSAPQIVGAFLLEMKKPETLTKLAFSKSLWERRISIVATFTFIRAGIFTPTLEVAERLISDKHDLIHKAVGWMLREVGKRNESVLRSFLDTHITTLPRTTLRYAIERFDPIVRKEYLLK